MSLVPSNSPIDHWRSRSKGWIYGPPLIHTYIQTVRIEWLFFCRKIAIYLYVESLLLPPNELIYKTETGSFPFCTWWRRRTLPLTPQDRDGKFPPLHLRTDGSFPLCTWWRRRTPPRYTWRQRWPVSTLTHEDGEETSFQNILYTVSHIPRQMDNAQPNICILNQPLSQRFR
jgi:hypothetical protein